MSRSVSLRRAVSSTAILLAALCAPAPGVPDARAAQAEPLSVREMLAHAFPSGLLASADERAVVWVLNEEGRRNVWVAEAPGFVGRRLTAYDLDDGQEISDRQFVDEDTLLCVRGGSPNRAGEFPNPATFATGVGPSRIWTIDLTGGEPRELVAGWSPVVIDGGAAMLFSNRGGLMWMELTGPDAEPADGTNEPRTMLEIRGGINGARLSPYGTRVAFSSSRGTHSYIGVVSLPGPEPDPARRVTWIDPSVDSDAAPVWSHDGTRIAFVREPARRAVELFAPRREGRPWSIRVALATGGPSGEIFTADPGSGSVVSGIGMPHSPHASGGLVWSAGDHIAFAWEKTGWRGIYSVPTAGGPVREVAVGAFEAETAALTADGLDLLVVSNQDDIDRRHLWRVPIDGSRPAARLTTGEWIEWSPVQVGDGYAWLRSSGTVPAHAV